MKKYYIRKAISKDIDSIVGIYNSNKTFLINHLGYSEIDNAFIYNEMKEMNINGFLSCVIVDIEIETVVGVIDYKPENTVYLSLLMLNSNLQGSGIGKRVYRIFEESMMHQGKQSVRIDVVNDYLENVIPFWSKQGFVAHKETKINWGIKESTALIMLKALA